MAPVLCNDCGLEFKYMDAARKICFKCEKLDQCNGNKTEMTAVEALRQCSCCGLVYKYLPEGRLQCALCDRRAQSQMSSDDKENVPKTKKAVPDNTKSKSSASKTVISVDDDSDGSNSDIEELPNMTVLKAQVAQNKKAASGIRLTPKVKTESEELSVRTREFFKLRQNAKSQRSEAKTNNQLLFKVTINLQKPAGQKVGTRVPVQSRGFPFEDKMEHVFKTMVNMVQEPDGRWAKEYPNKTFQCNDVHFTFSGGMDIPANTLKKSAIANFVADITMLVPIELTLDAASSDSEGDLIDQILGSGKKRSKSSSKNHRNSKRVKVKQEESDVIIKPEPMESDDPLYRTQSVIRHKRGKTPSVRLNMTSPVTFTKEFLTNTLEKFSSTNEEFHGLRDLVGKITPSLGSHFQLSCDDKHYLARRFELAEFRFDHNQELEAARGELNRGHQLKLLLQTLNEKFGSTVPELSTYSTPDLFIATVREQNVVLGHLVCQERPEVAFNKVVEPELDILNAISHYSLFHTSSTQLFTKFKVAYGETSGCSSIFAPITHSMSSTSGLYDEGPEAIGSFQADHICSAFCVQFGLEPF
ncbi:hypothetical protein MSAN_00564600 [Mycena sanguinolenta]|uniref:Alpha-type protein kinase domain-containing protein n=1 Tax=Mycena sanguinolenta TaxID=230812 RepID=A0A8H7DHN5_9AGAR|nr:hypothetical protein MSAN_00564600 [Mycena sanguinolenta]